MNTPRLKRQTIQLWQRNLPVFLLAFAASGLLAVAAADTACANADLGRFGSILDPWLLGLTKVLWIVVVVGLVYLPIGWLMALLGHPAGLRSMQRCLVQPYLSPVLFQTSGFFAGMATPLLNRGHVGLAQITAVLLLPVCTLAVATIFHSSHELLTS